MSDERWTRVLSAGELRAGVVIKLTNSRNFPSGTYDGKTYGTMLTRQVRPGIWEGAPRSPTSMGRWGSDMAIREGRLFRLETNLSAEDENPYLAHAPKKVGVR